MDKDQFRGVLQMLRSHPPGVLETPRSLPAGVLETPRSLPAVSNHSGYERQDYWGLEFVRGSEGYSDKTPTAWLLGGGHPPYQEVVTKFPLCGATELVAYVECTEGQSTLSFGLIVPDDRRLRYYGKKNGERPRLSGKLWAWESKSGEIYTKSFDSKTTFGGVLSIMRHACRITKASDLRVYRDFKRKTVHFIIDGNELKVACDRNEPDFCYGYLRMGCQNADSRIRITLVPGIEAYNQKTSSSVELLPKKGIFGFFPTPQSSKTDRLQDSQISTEPPDLGFYQANSPPDRLCLIINNAPNLPKSEKQLANLFNSLAFKVLLKRGLTMVQIYDVAKELAGNVPTGCDWFVCIAISFGNHDHEITGVDTRKASVEQVMSEFKASNCPSLKNKPKLFFVLRFAMLPAAGLVESHDSSMQAWYCTDKTSHQAKHKIDVCPEEADFLLVSATSSVVEGQQSPKHLFVKVLKKVVKKYKDVFHLLEMLTKVSEGMKETGGQVPYLTHTLRHKVRLGATPETVRHEASVVPDPLQVSRYEMNNRLRGYCLIINNFKFQEEHVRDRKGAEEDEKSLKTLFDTLQFEVIIRRDLDKHELEKLAEEYGSKNHYKYDAFFMIVMSHGGDGDSILGVDGRETTVRNLMVEFRANKCQSLEGKPKVFIIQTCRGSMGHLTETFPSPPVGSINTPSVAFKLSPADNQSYACPFSPDSNLPRSVFPPEADFLLAFATVPGYVSFRSPRSGTFFIQALVEVIRDYHDRHHLLDILTDVTRRVVDHQNRLHNMGIPVQVPAPTHTLTKQLYLK